MSAPIPNDSPAREPHLYFLPRPETTPEASLAADQYWLHRCVTADFDAIGVLRVYSFAGDVVSLGRYHLAPDPPQGCLLELHRRLGGGRVLPHGHGFVGISLILPHRGALLGQPAASLQAYQVLNRCVRGLLEACRLANLAPIYPGLDTVTLRRLPFACLSMEESAQGAVLFEAVIANTRDFSVLPHWVDRVDASGCLVVPMIDTESVTCLRRELAVELSFADVAELIRRGFEKQFSIPTSVLAEENADTFCASTLTPGGEGVGRHADAWHRFEHHASEHTQLGTFAVHVSTQPGPCVGDVLFTGDFLASAESMQALQSALQGCACEAAAMDAVVQEVFANPSRFLLGVGPLSIVSRLLLRALA